MKPRETSAATTRIAVVGAAGRMGLALIRYIPQVEGLALAAAIEAPGHPRIGADCGALAGIGENGLAISDQLQAALETADVMIDFTFHEAVPGNIAAAAESGKAAVIGTTSLSEAETAAVRTAAGRIPIVWAPNMSLGMNLLFSLVGQAAAVLGLDYDAEIVEMHHRLKKDAPSGSAQRLAERVAEGRGQNLDAVTVHGRSGLVGERPRGEIGVHAVRGGDVVGDHTVIFAIEGERIELGHRATSRDTFAMGALRASRWVAGRPAGLYDMQDVLGLRA